MKGWLIVNNFVSSEKSRTMWSMFIASAQKCGIELELKRTGELCLPIGGDFGALPDFAIFWDKDIHLAARLESKGLRLFNSSRAVELCDNKVLTYMELEKCSVPYPLTFASPKTYPSIGYSNINFAQKAAERLGYPLVIKEAYGSFGQQVYLVSCREELSAVVRRIGSGEFVMQRFVSGSRGRDVRVNVVGDRAVASIYRYNDNDFRSNISNGGKMQPYEINKQQEEIAVAACKALGLDFGGVDLLFDGEGYTVCEVNSNPHFRSTYDCTGVDVSEYILRYIGESL